MPHVAAVDVSCSSQLGLYSILAFTHESYSPSSTIASISAKIWAEPQDLGIPEEYYAPHDLATNATRRANATLLMLARNSDVDGAVRSVRELEDKFNRRYNYPWVFLNEQEFSADFKM